MKIYIISLLSDFKRREKLRVNFYFYFDQFEFLYAKDKKCAKEYIKYKCYKDGMVLSEIACALSHTEILNRLCKSEDKFSLILEDDIVGGDYDIEKIKNICKILPQNSIFITGGQDGLRSYSSLYGTLIDKDYNIYKIPKLYYRYLARTCCYAISKVVAEHIVAQQNERLITADQWDVLLKNCDHVYFSPILKHPISLGDSHIEAERKIKKGNNIFIAIYREGVFHSLYFFLRKKATSLWARVRKYQNIKKENI